MIEWKRGNIWDSEAECIVIPVNCFMVCGAGLAKEAYRRYKEDIDSFWNIGCQKIPLTVGSYYHLEAIDGKHLMFFTTKYDWRHPSQYNWIEDGLKSWSENAKNGEFNWMYNSIAFPILGGGLGKLYPEKVKDIMKKYLNTVSYPYIEVWEI